MVTQLVSLVRKEPTLEMLECQPPPIDSSLVSDFPGYSIRTIFHVEHFDLTHVMVDVVKVVEYYSEENHAVGIQKCYKYGDCSA